MVGSMSASWGERAASLLNSAKTSREIPAKMEQLRQLKEVLLHRDPSLLPEFAPRLAELQTGQPGPVRKFLAEVIREIGIKHMESLPEMIPTLICFLKDETPAVARQAITTGISLFHSVLEKVAIQGLYSSELNDSVDSSWKWMLKFKDAALPMAFQPGSDGVRLLAIKFVEAMILLYTPDPNISSEPPHEVGDGSGFNISWLRGGHPVLKVGDLAIEASQCLGLLLDQLRLPQVKSLSNSIIIVLINCLSIIAKKRPSFYGRILPVLLCLDPAYSVIKGVEVSGAYHALKSAFVACLECTHPGAAPWRVRLIEALKTMNSGKFAEEAVYADKSCGSMAVSTGESYSAKEEKLPLRTCDEGQGELGRKRSITEEIGDLVRDDNVSGKKVRSTPILSQETAKESLETNPDHIHDNIASTGVMASIGNGDSGPVQQLVGMFGALVAQGGKAAESLEILVSRISADLLAEVVMANMWHLPLTSPKTEDEEERSLSVDLTSSLIGEKQPFVQPSLVSDILSISSALSMITSQPLATHDIPKLQLKDEVKTESIVDAPFVLPNIHGGITKVSTTVSIPSTVLTAQETEGSPIVLSSINNLETLESKIPGLESTSHLSEIQESLDVSCSSTAELQGTSQEQVTSSDSTLPLETTSSSVTLPGTGLSSCTISTSVASSSQYFLPKMTAPVVSLTDEQKDNLQKVAFVRIIDAYKQIVVSGGSQIRFSLLACLGVEFPSELDAWGLLQKHILSDYLNHEGHELTLRVLYRLYQESEQDQDFFSSTTATSVYETFLLTVAETLRDSFPASDKSLSRLLGEVPYLTRTLFKLLECMCSPESNEKSGKDFQGGDRVTQGLSSVWSLILLRPSNRDMCLNIALQSAVHHLEEVRMKAIRLVANKLFPMSCIAKKIEDFANEMLHSVVDGLPDTEGTDAESSNTAPQKVNDSERPSHGRQTPVAVSTGELSSDGHQLCKTETMTTSLISEAQQRMSLYFALCTKKHSLLQQIFGIYRSIPKPAKQAVHNQIPILVRTIGSSSELLRIISDPPTGCESLLMQVLHTLTDGTIPSQELIFSVKRLYESKLKDVEILIPILSSLSKDEVLPIFPQLVNLSMDKFQAALARILQGSPHTSPSITPAEVLIAIHEIDPEKDGISLKRVMDASSACFEQRQVFTQQVLAKALNQLVEQIPLPLLFMRTVIQAVGAFPALVDFVMEILSRLVNKQIWKYPKLWVGFLKCALQTKPQSLNVLLQLPAAQLENAMTRNPALKSPLIEHASQPNIRTTLPRSSLVVLGLAPESQTSGPTLTTESQAAGTGNSVPDGETEITQESTAVS